ncbi:hypothetical protein ABEG17_05715 [Pedococcus sp. KACC 23699]|uniref:Uncharacterized protein n=1 Tax=Pedococcus sp. KACC 23699 TaxID=3149228 RepID=A0AAU7JX83_9MICO
MPQARVTVRTTIMASRYVDPGLPTQVVLTGSCGCPWDGPEIRPRSRPTHVEGSLITLA